MVVSLSGQPVALSHIVLNRAENRALDVTIEATAQLQANASQLTKVRAPVSGKITEVKACLGESVKKGQVIASIQSQEIGALVTDLFKTETEIDSQLSSDLMQTDFELKEANAELALCKKQFERARLLLDEKIGSQAAMETAQTELEKHDLTISALESKCTKLRKIAEDRKKMARISLQQRLAVLGMQQNTIKKIMSDRSIVNSIPIETPQGGIVLERNVNVGELVDPSTALFVVDDIDNLWLVADIFEQDVEHVRAGQSVEFKVDCFPSCTYKGKLDYVAGTINPETRTLAVRAVVANPGLRLKPKMFARMRIFCDRHNVLAVPKEAIQDAGSHKVAYVPVAPGKFEERRVKVGEENGKWMEVLDGLKPGEQVVETGSFALRSQALKQER